MKKFLFIDSRDFPTPKDGLWELSTWCVEAEDEQKALDTLSDESELDRDSLHRLQVFELGEPKKIRSSLIAV